ncbi:alpha/beta hydrolase [Spiroplasma sp. BIUS-1]|uniref:alpha/beta hydrolase n=1 Tax=Spiroplasma sp. BIUS-1 TaxID=216964 RepID=UPI0013978514|nr:alpha/beta fold hydrolase [Spiroplasma sp. BIUS-1]QHX36341.1 alpha/beta fold hydrolase [Spiroplasma sp. BIUS-1]
MKKIRRIRKNTLINRVKKGFRTIYSGLEKPFSEPSLLVSSKVKKFNKTKQDKKWLKALLTTNKVVTKFYKRPELAVQDIQNIEAVNFKARDGIRLFGLVYEPNKDSNKWVIASHWFAGHKNWSLHHAKPFAKMGYNIFVYDFRGHGQSEDDSTTMGGKEQFDLMGAVDWLRENKKVDSLAFMGTSMGGFVSNYCAMKYKDELKKLNLKFVVSDVTYGSVFSLFLHVRNIYLGFLPKRRTKKSINRVIEKQNRKEGNINLHEISIFHLLRENGNKDLFPTLFLHSTDDKVTSPADTYELIIKRDFEKDDYLVFNFSMHTQAMRYHFKTFNYKIAEFINKYEPDQEKFDNLVKEWQLLKFDKKDQISLLLK